MKKLLAIFFLFLISCEQSNTICATDKLYGNWAFVGMYPGRLTKIDTLRKNNFTSVYGTQNCIYSKSGIYVNDQGDYKTTGNFTIDNQGCIIKQFDDNDKKGDTLNLEITYLDNQYLLVVANTDISSFSYFYKRNKSD